MLHPKNVSSTTMEPTDAHSVLRSAKPLETLKKIASCNSLRDDDEALTAVRVFLSGGHVLDGYPIDAGDDGHALLWLDSGDHLFLDLSTLAGLQIRTSSRVLEVLTDGRFYHPPSENVPSLLNLKRSFAEAKEQLSNQFALVKMDGPVCL